MGLAIKTQGESNFLRKLYIFFFFSCLTVLSIIRSLSVGPDTSSYYDLAQEIYFRGWGGLWYETRMRYFHSVGTRDMGYFLFVKFIQIFSTNFDFLSFVACAIYLIPLGILLYRFSTNMNQLMFAFVLYSALFSINTVSPNRQLFASGFCIMALLALYDNKFWKSIILIVVGMTFHQTCMIFFGVPILVRFFPKMIKKIHMASFFMVPIFILFASQIMFFMSDVSANERYAVYSETEDTKGGGVVFAALLECLSLFCYFGIKKNFLQTNRKALLLYTMTPFFTMFGPLILQDGTMIRLSKYFHLYLMLLVPYAIEQLFKKENMSFVYTVAIIAMVALGIFGSGQLEYHTYVTEPYLHNVAT